MTTTTTTTTTMTDPSTLLRALVATDDRIAPAVARVTLGAVILPHGLQKTLGLFGGYGFSDTMGFLTGAVGLPSVVALAVILAESVGALALIAGLGSRLNAALIGAVMIGATLTAHLQHGFFMNWAGSPGGEGFEYHLLALGLAAVVILAGGGRASVDRWLGSAAS